MSCSGGEWGCFSWVLWVGIEQISTGEEGEKSEDEEKGGSVCLMRGGREAEGASKGNPRGGSVRLKSQTRLCFGRSNPFNKPARSRRLRFIIEFFVIFCFFSLSLIIKNKKITNNKKRKKIKKNK